MSRLLHLFQRPRQDYEALPTSETPRVRYSRWKSIGFDRIHPALTLKRCLLLAPVLILVSFGIVHVLELIIGPGHLFWNVSARNQAVLNCRKPSDGGLPKSTHGSEVFQSGPPIPCHSHNDYWRPRPLFDALYWGCTSVEPDVWVSDEELYVGHNTRDLDCDRTFQKMYVNPLMDWLDRVNSARDDERRSTPRGVFDSDPEQTLVLLVDFKRESEQTFDLLERQLQPFRDRGYLSYWNGSSLQSGPVTVVATGRAPFERIIRNTTHRDVFFDAPLDAFWEEPQTPIASADALHEKDKEMDQDATMAVLEDEKPESVEGGLELGFSDNADDFNPSTSYYASTSLKSAVGFVWFGLSSRQMRIIRGQIQGAKRRGLKARYWDTPSWPKALRNQIWRVLMSEGADVLNVDDLEAAATQDWIRPEPEWL